MKRSFHSLCIAILTGLTAIVLSDNTEGASNCAQLGANNGEIRTTLVVGKHINSTNANSANFIAGILQQQLNHMAEQMQGGDSLTNYFDCHAAVSDSTVGLSIAELRARLLSDPQALLVLGGVVLAGEAGTSSTIYFGEKAQRFSIDRSSVNIQTTQNFANESKYVNLLILYAMIKEAMAQDLDMQRYVAPMKSEAHELLADLVPLDFRRTREISVDLEALD